MNLMECTVCHRKFGFRYNLSRHEALNHPEHFLIAVKSELATAAQFRLLVKQIYLQDLQKYDKILGLSKTEGTYKC